MASIYTSTPFSPEEIAALQKPDPQAAYAEMMKTCPVHRGPDGTITLMRMEDIVAVARRPDVLGTGAHGPTMGGARKLIPLDLDGPEHMKYRRLLDPLFSGKRAAALEPVVRELANELIDAFIDKKEADLSPAFCQALPSQIFLRQMGLPAKDLAMFVEFKNVILGHLPPMPLPERMAKIRAASARCYEYLGAALDERIARPTDDLLGQLLVAEVDGEKLTREQILDIGYLMVIAGLDTVVASLACAIARLARMPELRRRLTANPSLWGGAVDEFLRFESPAQRSFRTATQDLQIGGETIPAGTTFFIAWASANLDETAFENPLTFNPERKPNAHVAFGSGFHRCLGVQLARMELRVALEELHKRIPDYAFKPGHELAFIGMPRTVNGLPLQWR